MPTHIPSHIIFQSLHSTVQITAFYKGVALVTVLILSNLDCKRGHKSHIVKN